MIASFSFASTAHVTQWSNNLTQQAEILTQQSNLTPQQAKNTGNDLSVVSVVAWGTGVTLDIKQVGFTVSYLFSSRDQQAAVVSLLRMEAILANTSLLLDTLRKKMDLIDILAPSFTNRQNCSHNRAAKRIL